MAWSNDMNNFDRNLAIIIEICCSHSFSTAKFCSFAVAETLVKQGIHYLNKPKLEIQNLSTYIKPNV
jgi:hypothetical protein